MNKKYNPPKTRKTIFLASLALGILLSAVAFIINQEIVSELLLTMGVCVTLISAIELARIKLDPSGVKQEEMEAKDERNIQIAGKAATFAWAVSFWVYLPLMVYFNITEQYVAAWLAFAALGIQIATFYIARLYFRKKM